MMRAQGVAMHRFNNPPQIEGESITCGAIRGAICVRLSSMLSRLYGCIYLLPQIIREKVNITGTLFLPVLALKINFLNFICGICGKCLQVLGSIGFSCTQIAFSYLWHLWHLWQAHCLWRGGCGAFLFKVRKSFPPLAGMVKQARRICAVFQYFLVFLLCWVLFAVVALCNCLKIKGLQGIYYPSRSFCES